MTNRSLEGSKLNATSRKVIGILSIESFWARKRHLLLKIINLRLLLRPLVWNLKRQEDHLVADLRRWWIYKRPLESRTSMHQTTDRPQNRRTEFFPLTTNFNNNKSEVTILTFKKLGDTSAQLISELLISEGFPWSNSLTDRDKLNVYVIVTQY